MNLYLIKRTDKIGWDEWDSIVVAAKTPKDAIKIHPSGRVVGWNEIFSGWTNNPKNVKVTLIGEAEQKEPGVILASFNAG